MRSEIVTKPVIDIEDIYPRSVDIPALSGDGATQPPVVIASKRLKMGCKAFLRALGNAVQPGGETYLTFQIRVNGAALYPYDGSNNQWGDPALLQDIPQRVDLGQGALLEVVLFNSHATDTFSATARVWVDYENF